MKAGRVVGVLGAVPAKWRPHLRQAGEKLLPPAVRRRREQERREAAEARKAADRERKARELREERRRSLLESDPDLRRFATEDGELIGRTVRHFSATAAAHRNLAAVTTALEAAGIDYFLVPGNSSLRHVVGVHHSRKKEALAVLAQRSAEAALYAAKPAPRGAISGAPVLCAEGLLPKKIKSLAVIRFGEHLLGPDAQILAGLDHGCDVEFWNDGSDVLASDNAEEHMARLRVMPPASLVAESWIAPRRNQVSDVLPPEARKPATVEIAGRLYTTFTPLVRPDIEHVDFPIDAVYTWVDGSDPELAAKRARYRGDAQTMITARVDSRYTNRDELRYSLRSVEMFAPFIRHIYIVTDGQVPQWLDTTAKGVTVVDHRDVFSDPSALPVFNSHAIESQLHHIEGLAEHYLYFNDDMFFGRPVGPEQFFHGSGIARVPVSPNQIGLGEPHTEEPAPSSAGKNVRALLAQAFGRAIHAKYKHVPQPQLRSIMTEMEQRFPEEWDATMRSRFRSIGDIAVTATLHNAYARLSARAVPGEYQLRYVNIAFANAAQRMAELTAQRHYDFFCINETDTPEELRERSDTMVREFLENYFPFASRFEKPGT